MDYHQPTRQQTTHPPSTDFLEGFDEDLMDLLHAKLRIAKRQGDALEAQRLRDQLSMRREDLQRAFNERFPTPPGLPA